MTETPHAPYISTVIQALTTAGHHIEDAWTTTADGPGTHPQLTAVITLDTSPWPDGILLRWEWHGTDPDGIYPPGPSWEWLRRHDTGTHSEPAALRVDGWADPASVLAAVHSLLNTGHPTGSQRAGRWDGAAALERVIQQWAATMETA
ncbi:hypothetical protein [Streptomyces rubradiris]|uniref:Uncharacterized protein n=1 Tax=Streptomyces rubradiris TaxID=285531 RepID=A0ABQ3R3F5_STRRR|nr:hypothetical protein [Streptomyces rubradiris]GHH30081.1 hypothetical protein GCM10018792_76050 [Streptomyces rubradiris]GHI50386.1 hypothetical protein Srubr_02320 [Streptomyces rubradiris]